MVVVVGLVVGTVGGAPEGVTGIGLGDVEPQSDTDSSEPSTQSMTPLHFAVGLIQAP